MSSRRLLYNATFSKKLKIPRRLHCKPFATKHLFNHILPVKTLCSLTRNRDIIFLQDATASQSPYIDKARTEINRICQRLVKAGAVGEGEGYLRMGLIAFRDHPPQDRTFVTQEYQFTTSTSVMASNLKGLSAHGGGDGPESQTDAMNGALNAKWREDATKIVILITDAPPHGLGESGDGFPNGCPCRKSMIRSFLIAASCVTEDRPLIEITELDPIEIADQMSQKGITLVSGFLNLQSDC